MSGVGIGAIVGDPTGVSAKIWTSTRTAIQCGAAWSFRGPGDDGSLHFHVDYIRHRDLSDDIREQAPHADLKGLPMFYFGIGGRLRNDPGDARLSVRAPLGIAHAFGGAPVDFFIEAVPLLDVAPETEFDINAALGVRFFF